MPPIEKRSAPLSGRRRAGWELPLQFPGGPRPIHPAIPISSALRSNSSSLTSGDKSAALRFRFSFRLASAFFLMIACLFLR